MAKKRTSESQLTFGGSWTEEKLVYLQKYLKAYSQIFAKNPRARYFHTHYVDAFAGTGFIPKPEGSNESLFPELREEVEQYTKGSATRALEVDPGFDHYLFIEQDPGRASDLGILKTKFPALSDRIEIKQANANEYLKQWTEKTDWSTNRAVVFLDPFGMEVSWQLIESLAETRGVDLWILFPLSATNRMLVNRGKPPDSWSRRLTNVFGTPDWENLRFREINACRRYGIHNESG